MKRVFSLPRRKKEKERERNKKKLACHFAQSSDVQTGNREKEKMGFERYGKVAMQRPSWYDVPLQRRKWFIRTCFIF